MMMDRNELRDRLRDRVLLLDGSYGAQFIKGSGGKEIVPETLNLVSPEIVEELESALEQFRAIVEDLGEESMSS